MTPALILIPAAFLLAGLLYFEKKAHLKGLLPTKTLMSALFVLCAAIQPRTFAPLPGARRASIIRPYHHRLPGLLLPALPAMAYFGTAPGP